MKPPITEAITDEEFCVELPDLTEEQYFEEYPRYITAHKVISYMRDRTGFFDESDKKASKDALIFGSACHKLLLEGSWEFSKDYAVCRDDRAYGPTGRFCGRNSKRWKEVTQHLGYPTERILHEREFELLRTMHLAWTASDESDLFTGCKIERPIRWCMHGMRWQAKIDGYDPMAHHIFDLKTTHDIGGIAGAIVRYGYDIQAAVYCLAYEALYGVFPAFSLIFIEKNEGARIKRIDFDFLDLASSSGAVEYWSQELRDDILARWPR